MLSELAPARRRSSFLRRSPHRSRRCRDPIHTPSVKRMRRLDRIDCGVLTSFDLTRQLPHVQACCVRFTLQLRCLMQFGPLLVFLVALATSCGSQPTGSETHPMDSHADPDVGIDESDVAQEDSASRDDTNDVDAIEDTRVLDTAIADDTERPDAMPQDVDADVDADWDTEEASPETIGPPPEPQGPTCQSNADCHSFPDRRLCDLAYHRCVQCITTPSCGWDQICIHGECSGEGKPKCLLDTDCAASEDGPVCLPGRMVCGECYEDWQCSTGHVCRDEHCVAGVSQTVFCSSTIQCPGLLVCSDFGHCVECETNAECENGDVCERWHCATPAAEPPRFHPRACISDNDCRDLGVDCNLTVGFCQQAPVCRDDADCPMPYQCIENVCYPSACDGTFQSYCVSKCRDFGQCSSASGPTRFAVIECSSDHTWQVVSDCNNGCYEYADYRASCYDSSVSHCALQSDRVDGCISAYQDIRYGTTCFTSQACKCSGQSPPYCIDE